MTEGQKPARIRLGMVGGGRDAFIGAVHRIAARLDDHYELVAGALSASADKARASAADLGIAADRQYSDYHDMASREAQRDDGIEAVAIVTPNHLHYPVAEAFLKHGIHVICDKPLTSTLDDARALQRAVEASDALFVLTHNYTGYPMTRRAREMVANGDLGTIRVIQVEYPQDWLSEKLEDSGQKQASWRTDPARSGAGGCIGDIGTHAYNLACFISGQKAHSLCADLDTFVDGRKLDDNCHVMLRFDAGAKGMLWSSQVAPGNENALRIRIYGDKGGLEWQQENPNYLHYSPLGQPVQIIGRANAGSGEAAARVSRTPPGHPEGYLEGFANLYSEAAQAIIAARDGSPVPPEVLYPGIEDGVDGVAFVSACVESSASGSRWVEL